MADAWTSATPLRNADFKALLATPRPAGQQSQQSRASGGSSFKHPKAQGGADGEGKKFKKPAPKGGRGKPKDGKDKDDEDGPQYRDRAKERRDGVSVDFADAEQELAARGLGPQALSSLSIEQSKFLGGDIAHTHLVKGLDYALLQQERSKLETGGGGGGSAAAAAAASAAAAAAEEAEAAQRQAAAAVSFAGAAGRSLYNAVFRPPPHNRALVRESFQPRRTAFVFEFEDGASDVPTTLRRSKADCPPVQDVVSASSDGALLDRISKIMSYINQTSGKGGKRSARDSQYIRSILAGVNPAAPGDAQVHGQLVMKGQAAITAAAAAAAAAAAGTAAVGGGGAPAAAAPAAAAAAAPVEDDDIFGDAGTDYAPVIPQKQGAAAEGRRAEGLFSSREHQEALQAPPQHAGSSGGGAVDMDTEEGELPGQRRQRLPGPPSEQQQQQAYPGYPAQGSWQQQQQQQQPVEQPKWRVATKPGAAAAALAEGSAGLGDDAYAECFPTMADYGTGDDDEEELDPKAAKRAAAAEAAAAAKGGGKGGKGGGGGAGGGMDDAERKLHQKLSKEVQQMQGIFKEKGWGSEAAFDKKGGRGGRAAPSEDPAIAATPARKRLRI